MNYFELFQNEIHVPFKQIIEHYKESAATEKELLQVKEDHYKKKFRPHQLSRKM